MTLNQLAALEPLLFISGAIVFLLLQVAFFRGHRAALITTLLALILAAASCYRVATTLPEKGVTVTGLLLIDHYSLFICLLLLFTAIATAVLGFHYLRARLGNRATITDGRGSFPEEFYILLLLAVLGACTLVCASHFASFFLGLELMSLSLYPLLAFSVHGDRSPLRDQLMSLESGFKYLLMSAFATALGLFGMAFIFAAGGTLEFIALAGKTVTPLMSGGLALLLIAIAFKLSLVPFHIWTPDVYQGAPTPVTAFIATLGKGAVVAWLLKFFTQMALFEQPTLTHLLALMAAASMVLGNLLALQQSNIKRLLAYSSIAHIGYLFVAFLVGAHTIGREAVTYYLVAYVITTLGAFAVVSLVADSLLPHTPGGHKPLTNPATDPFHRDFYRGLFWRSPWLALCFAAMLLSLAGIPLTIGFVGKFYIFTAGVEAELWWLLLVVILGSALGLFYYLRLLLVMVQREESTGETPPQAIAGIQIAISGRAVLLILTVALFAFGVFPQLLINPIIAL